MNKCPAGLLPKIEKLVLGLFGKVLHRVGKSFPSFLRFCTKNKMFCTKTQIVCTKKIKISWSFVHRFLKIFFGDGEILCFSDR